MAKVNTNDMKRMIVRIASEEGVPANVMLAIAEHESGFDPNAKNFSSKEKSYGMFQINTKAHPDYKGGFNPEANTRYACRFFKGLLNRYNGDVAKAIERYNGSGQDARNYAKKVINNVLPKYNNVANNANQVATNVNDKTLKGGVSQNNMQQEQSNQQTQNASDTIMTNLNPDYFTPQYPQMATSDYTGGVPQTQLVNQATFEETPAVTAYKQFLAGLKSFDELNAQFPQLVQELGITKDMERKSPASDYTRDMNERVMNALTVTPEMQQQAQQNVLAQNEQLNKIATQQSDALNKIMMDAYNNQVNAINRNPYGDVQNADIIDSEALRRARLNDMRRNMYYASMGVANPIMSDEDILLSRLKSQRDAQMMNKYGVSADEAKQIAVTQYNNTVAAAKQNVDNAKYQYQIGNITSQQLMKIIADNNNAVNNAKNESAKLMVDYAKSTVPQMYQSDVELSKATMGDAADINKSARGNASALAQENMKAQNLADIAAYEGAVDAYKTQVGANTDMYGTNVDALTEAAKLQQGQQQFQQGLPAEYLKATGSFLTGAGLTPQVDIPATASQFGVNIQKTNPLNPRSTSVFNGGLTGLMQGIYRDRLLGK